MSSTIATPRGIETVNASPEISRYYNDANTPYINTAQVIAEVLENKRYIGQTFNVAGVEYTFKSGKTDDDLELKASSTSSENRLLETTSLQLVGNTLTYGADSSRLIQGVEYTNPTDLTVTVPAEPNGFKRVDRILTGKNNVLTVITGTSSGSTAYPAPYDGTEYAELTFVNVDGANFNVIQPDLSVYRKKQEVGVVTISHTEASTFLIVSDKGTFRFTGTKERINYIADFTFNSPLYEGRELVFINLQDTPIILPHLYDDPLAEFPEPLNKVFEFHDGLDYVLQPNETIVLKYMGALGVFNLISSTNFQVKDEDFIISSSTTILPSMNGKNIYVIGNITLTIPSTLPVSFKMTFITELASTITWAIIAPHTWYRGTPTVTPADTTGFLGKKGSTNSIQLRF